MTLNIGDVLTNRAQLADLPIGTVIDCPVRYGLQTKISPVTWRYERGTRDQDSISPEQFDYTVVSLPDATPVEPPLVEPTETLVQYQQRFRAVVLAKATAAGVTKGPIVNALRRLDVADPPLSIGSWVHTNDGTAIGAIPGETLLWAEEGVVVAVRRGGSIAPVLGSYGSCYTAKKVLAMPGHTEPLLWVNEKGTQVDVQMIEQFKKAAWELGYRLKYEVSPNWCTDFEAAMAEMGITGAEYGS